MKKIIVLMFIILIVTGCTAEYNLKIDNGFVKNQFNIKNYDKSTWDNEKYLYAGMKYKEKMSDLLKLPQTVYKDVEINPYDEYTKIEGVEYYNQKILSDNNVYGITYTYDFPIEKYGEAASTNYCYDEFDFTNKDKIMKISTSSTFNCFTFYEMLDKVEVNITTSWDYKVISSNADKVEDGKYTWIITKENASNKPIEIEIKKVINWRLLLIILVPSIAIIAVVYFIIKRKIIKNNQI